MNRFRFKLIVFLINWMVTFGNGYDFDIERLDVSYPWEFNEIKDGIVGGLFATRGRFKYQAYLTTFYPSKSKTCGGSLISRQWVLTAAHCVYDNGVVLTTSYHVNLGIIRVSETRNAHVCHGRRAIPHPQYNQETKINDIAVLQIDCGNFNWHMQRNAVGTIPLIQDDYQLTTSTTLYVMGYGRIDEDAQINAEELRYATMNLISTRKCEKYIGREVQGNLCAQNPDKSQTTCRGDSGSPMVIIEGQNHYQVGIVSFGKAKCRGSRPSVYTDVRYHRRWINRVTGGNF